MSSMNIFGVAASGMSAQNHRMNLVASNMANIDAVSSSKGETYRSRQPVFQSVMDTFGNNNGVAKVKMAGVVESDAPLISQYAPNHPMSNEEGYIFKPNVNPMEEMANMISASRAYQNNVEVVNTAKQMMTSIINLGR